MFSFLLSHIKVFYPSWERYYSKEWIFLGRYRSVTRKIDFYSFISITIYLSVNNPRPWCSVQCRSGKQKCFPSEKWSQQCATWLHPNHEWMCMKSGSCPLLRPKLCPFHYHLVNSNLLVHKTWASWERQKPPQ